MAANTADGYFPAPPLDMSQVHGVDERALAVAAGVPVFRNRTEAGTTRVPEDACDFGAGTDAAILACDYTGLYETHYCRNGSWAGDVQDRLDRARTVAELRETWQELEPDGKTDGYGGAEWHHAVAHLRYWLETPTEEGRRPA